MNEYVGTAGGDLHRIWIFHCLPLSDSLKPTICSFDLSETSNIQSSSMTLSNQIMKLAPNEKPALFCIVQLGRFMLPNKWNDPADSNTTDVLLFIQMSFFLLSWNKHKNKK